VRVHDTLTPCPPEMLDADVTYVIVHTEVRLHQNPCLLTTEFALDSAR
jgi:hypothetical protein